jgi:hypothetical protein
MASRSLADLDVFDNGAPWDLFAELRDTAPVNWSDETDGGSGFWSMMKYHDIVKVLRLRATTSRTSKSWMPSKKRPVAHCSTPTACATAHFVVCSRTSSRRTALPNTKPSCAG